MDNETILVVGATGTTGRRVADLLEAAGHPVRRASRGGEPPFDWTDRATWAATVEGARAMYLMAPDGQPVDRAFVGQAVEAGVRRIALLSSKAIEAMGDQRLLAAEETVRESGAEWTILRADWFDQNFDEGFLREAVLAGQVTVPVGDVRQTFVHAADLAAVAAAVLTETGHAGRTYELGGPEALTFAEAVGVIAAASGREVGFEGSPEAYAAMQRGFGTDEDQVAGELAAFEALRRSGHAEADDVVEQIIGRAPVDFRTYATDAAARGAWAG